MSCCGGKRSLTVQALTMAPAAPVPDGTQTNVIWMVKPAGFTKYVMRSGNSYIVYRKGAEVTVYQVDLPELRERGLIE